MVSRQCLILLKCPVAQELRLTGSLICSLPCVKIAGFSLEKLYMHTFKDSEEEKKRKEFSLI